MKGGQGKRGRATIPKENSALPPELQSFVTPAVSRWPTLLEHKLHQGAFLFIDIAGFTNLSEALSNKGREGAELLDRTITGYFNALLDQVDAYGGAPLKISGDAITVLFFDENLSLTDLTLQALGCAAAVMDAIPQGKFHNLKHKVGMGSGSFVAGLVGDPERRQEFVYGGEALEQAVLGEKAATAGEAWVSKEVASLIGHTPFLPEVGPKGQRRLHSDWKRDSDHRLLPQQHANPIDTSAFSAYIPKAVRASAADGTLAYLSRHQSLTALFIGSPSLMYSDPDHLADLDQYYREAQKIVEEHGGYLSEYEGGDKGAKLIAFFGAPTPLEDICTPAVRAMHKLMAVCKAKDLVGSLHIGCTTGRLYVGRIGCRRLVKYSALGDRMNLAARLMGKAGPWQLLAEVHTVKRCHSDFSWNDGEDIWVKGKKEAITVHTLLGKDLVGQRNRRGLGLIARESEEAIIRRHLVQVSVGQGGLLDVIGAPGVGKTRLSIALWRQATVERALSFFQWSGGVGRQGRSPLGGWLPLLRGLMGMSPNDSSLKKGECLTEWLAGIPTASPQTYALLSPLLGAPIIEDPIVDGLPPNRRINLLRRVVSDLLIDVLQERTQAVVLLLDDAQILDPLSLGIIQDLAPSLPELGLLIALFRRPSPEGEPLPIDGLEKLPLCEAIHLKPLEEEGLKTFAQKLLEGHELDHDLAAFLIKRTRGNPLLLEVWVDTLLVGGNIHKHEGTAYLVGDDDLELPDRLEGLYLTRLEHLTPAAQVTLRVASVVQGIFLPEHVQAIHPESPSLEVIHEHLKLGIQSTLLYRERSSPPWLFFSRPEVQQALHDSLPYKLRRQLHQKRAHYLENEDEGDNPDETTLTLAHHYRYINDPQAQFLKFTGAAQICEDRTDFRQALTWLKSSETCAEEGADLNNLMEALDQHQRVAGRLGERKTQMALCLRFAEAAKQAGNVYKQVAALTNLASGLSRQGRVEAAQARWDQAEILARLPGGSNALPYWLSHVISTKGESGKHAESMAYAEEAIPHLEAIKDPTLKLRLMASVAFAFGYASQNVRAIELIENAMTMAQTQGDRYAYSILIGNIGIYFCTMGQPERGHEALLQALTLKRQVGDRGEIAMGLLNVGFSQFQLGDIEGSKTLTQEALKVLHRQGYNRGVSICLANLAEMEIYTDAKGKGEQRCLDLKNHLIANPFAPAAIDLAILEGELALAKGELMTAERRFTGAIKQAKALGASSKERIAQMGLAESLSLRGRSISAMHLVWKDLSLKITLSGDISHAQRIFWKGAMIYWEGGNQREGDLLAERAWESLQETLSKIQSHQTRNVIIQAFPFNRAIHAWRPFDLKIPLAA